MGVSHCTIFVGLSEAEGGRVRRQTVGPQIRAALGDADLSSDVARPATGIPMAGDRGFFPYHTIIKYISNMAGICWLMMVSSDE